ncbi:hypothetical protein ALP26_102123 [Pseudomonas savastanoi pv. glycinea]|uniref:Uncharacterized protein n=3 Tax=Pseudomonas syringae group genomosp. 2 TaxID=251698 RepID=A0AB37QZY4_PSEAV|nr:Unknown protein sequence [Pseudomonas savastanoi pv. phaseolicola]KPB66878.1 Unknown protein sequence [Pseudomonas amygdali pv. mellea]KPB78687.1 Unknown protein sequence [Pseudomonas syringae pv. maculicola]KPC01739.1 Unknown protein sequence [Pseudomonas amygdali pv. lachrymans]KPC30403.1 Unknown protein sequence [Pseudomonas savastanoi pv. glycinea]
MSAAGRQSTVYGRLIRQMQCADAQLTYGSIKKALQVQGFN